MKIFDIKPYLHFLERNKLYTSINILGFAISLMFVIFITMYVTQETRTDTFHKNGDRIYVLGDEYYYGTHIGLPHYLEGRYPQIEDICTIATLTDFLGRADGQTVKVMPMFADHNFFEFFSFEIIEGTAGSPISDLSGAVLTQSFARKLFGADSPIGKTIELGYDCDKTFVVTAVVEDFRTTAIVSPDLIINLDNITHWEPLLHRTQINQGISCTSFLMAAENTDLKDLEPVLLEYFRTFYSFYVSEIEAQSRVVITPIKDVYLTDEIIYNYYDPEAGMLLKFGSRSIIKILLFVGLIMLLFAVTNYINLTVAQTTFRAKEMASRRLLGAGRGEIFGRFISESVLMCLISFFVGFLMVYTFEAQLSSLLKTNIHVLESFTWPITVFFAGLILLLGVISGLIPALAIMRFKPIDVVRGSFAYHSKQRLSKIFIILQYVITVSLLVFSTGAHTQIKYMIDKPKGYNSENILYVAWFGILNMYENEELDSVSRGIFEQMRDLPCVKRGGMVENSPGISVPQYGIDDNSGNTIWISTIRCDTAAFEILGFDTERIAGSEDIYGAWVNEALYNFLRSEGNAETIYINPDGDNIIGLLVDFQPGSVLEESVPYQAIVARQEIQWSGIFEIMGDHEEAIEMFRDVYAQYVDSDLYAKFIDDSIRDSYREITDQIKLINVALLFTIVVSALGLFAMSVYYINHRAGDIAIRKVFGSTGREVVGRLLRRFLMLVAAAYVIAIPLSYWFMDKWLSQYSYRIPLAANWWMFLTAGAFVFAAATLTVLWQSLRAANANPVKAIRN